MLPVWIALALWGGACCPSAVKTLRLVGGWVAQDPRGDPEFLRLARLAVSSKSERLEYYDTVIDLLRVATQVVAGTNYALTVKVAPSVCKTAEREFDSEECVPQKCAPRKICRTVVYRAPWMKTTVGDFSCVPVAAETSDPSCK